MSRMKATLEIRGDVEMTIGRLLQQYGIERTDIFITTEGADDSSGEEKGGLNTEAETRSASDRGYAHSIAGSVFQSIFSMIHKRMD